MLREDLMIKYKEVLLDLINIYKNKHVKIYGPKYKFNDDFYITQIFKVLFYGHTWNTLSEDCSISTIRKKHYKYIKMNIYNDAYQKMFKLYKKNMVFKHLFIDSTSIQNINCSDSKVTYGGLKFKGKKQLKLSAIVDSNKIPLAHVISSPKPHDVTFIEPLINELKANKINIKKGCLLVGDKGYICKKDKYKYKNRNIRLLTDKRKNQKIQITDKNDLKILKNRVVVEHSFANLKKYKRTAQLVDQKILNFKTFYIMSVTCQIIRKFK
jgi:hypothetical protein